MEVSTKKILKDKSLCLIAALHFSYAMQRVKNYEDLTESERKFISIHDFVRLQKIQ